MIYIFCQILLCKMFRWCWPFHEKKCTNMENWEVSYNLFFQIFFHISYFPKLPNSQSLSANTLLLLLLRILLEQY